MTLNEAQKAEQAEVLAILDRINTGMSTDKDAERLGEILRRAWDEERKARQRKARC